MHKLKKKPEQSLSGSFEDTKIVTIFEDDTLRSALVRRRIRSCSLSICIDHIRTCKIYTKFLFFIVFIYIVYTLVYKGNIVWNKQWKTDCFCASSEIKTNKIIVKTRLVSPTSIRNYLITITYYLTKRE